MILPAVTHALDLQLNSSPPCLLSTDANGAPLYGPCAATSSLNGYIQLIYRFGLGIGGILAVGMIVWGSILISISGSIDKEREGRDFITSALFGLALLFGAYLLLSQINPNLTSLIPPSAPAVTPTAPAAQQPCDSCTNISITSGITEIKCTTGNCQLNSSLWSKLRVAANNFYNDSNHSGTIAVTEAYPPAAQHQSTCHQNGTCADIALRPQNEQPNCSILNALLTDLSNAGLSPVNEYFEAPSPCTGKKFEYTTGGNIHVNM